MKITKIVEVGLQHEATTLKEALFSAIWCMAECNYDQEEIDEEYDILLNEVNDLLLRNNLPSLWEEEQFFNIYDTQRLNYDLSQFFDWEEIENELISLEKLKAYGLQHCIEYKVIEKPYSKNKKEEK